MNQLYDVIDSLGERVGQVNDKLLLRIKNKTDEKFDSIEELIVKVEFMGYYLNDMQGDLYSLTVHKEVVKQISKFGIGYIVR